MKSTLMCCCHTHIADYTDGRCTYIEDNVYIVSASWCGTCTSSLTIHNLRKAVTGEKEPRPGTRTCGLHSNTEFQPCEPLIRP